MRGDSLRDLYAKTLALCGLGLLAGAGALVDYWPVGVRLVSVSPALALPDMALPAEPSAVPEPVRDARLPRVARAAPPVPPTNASSDDAPSMAAAAEVPPTSWFDQPALGGDVPVAVLAEYTALPTSYVELASVVEEARLDLAMSTGTDPVGPWNQLPRSSAAVAAIDDDSGFISGALRKTRTSLVRTGARTGASIVDAVRVVGGAVRRALPN